MRNAITTGIAATALCILFAARSPADEPLGGAFSKAVAYAQARTVKVYGAAIGRVEGYATGILVSADGRILVAQGIYLAGQRIRVVLPDGSTHEARVERRSEPIQAAVLKIDAATPDFFKVPDKLPVDKGDWVLTVSNAFKVANGKEPLSVNVGVVSLITPVDAKRGTQDVPYEADALLYDAITSNPGAPGGAVVTPDGQLAGMIGKVIEDKTTRTRLNYAVPANLLADFLAGRPIGGSAAQPKGDPGELGLRMFGLGGRRSPAYIDRVSSSSPAGKAGLKADDLILAVDGKRVANVGEYKTIEKTFVAGKPVELLVKRKTQLLRMTITPRKK